MAATLRCTLTLLVLVSLVVVLGCDDGGSRDSDPVVAKGTLSGVVADNEDLLAEGESPQTYASASVRVQRAIEVGTYRVSAESPLQVSYTPGDVVAETTSEEQGAFSVDLEAGAYFVQAFHGDRSSSEKLFVEIEVGETTEVMLGLIHGV